MISCSWQVCNGFVFRYIFLLAPSSGLIQFRILSEIFGDQLPIYFHSYFAEANVNSLSCYSIMWYGTAYDEHAISL